MEDESRSFDSFQNFESKIWDLRILEENQKFSKFFNSSTWNSFSSYLQKFFDNPFYTNYSLSLNHQDSKDFCHFYDFSEIWNSGNLGKTRFTILFSYISKDFESVWEISKNSKISNNSMHRILPLIQPIEKIEYNN